MYQLNNIQNNVSKLIYLENNAHNYFWNLNTAQHMRDKDFLFNKVYKVSFDIMVYSILSFY